MSRIRGIAANEMLRTLFRWEKVENPVQIVLKEHKIQPVYHDLTLNSPGKEPVESKNNIKERIRTIKNEDRNKKFQLQEVPFRITLCKLGDSAYEVKNPARRSMKPSHSRWNTIIWRQKTPGFGRYGLPQKLY
ncbi:MAG: hypothetical protein GY757_30035 [bacterium]|nr:hypothetical protein [bacterium]